MREFGDEHDAAGESLPAWARVLLSEPASDGARGGAMARSAAAIMEQVRREPPHRVTRRLAPSMRASRWTRRGLLTPFGAAAFAGVLGLMLSVRAVTTLGGARGPSGMALSAAVIGDTVMPSLGDTVRDTLRIVEFVLRGPTAGGMPHGLSGSALRRVDVVGDFNGWRRGATAMAPRADGTWFARVLVPRDVVRFAYAVNDERADTPAAGDRPAGPQAPPPVMRARIDSI